MWDTLQVRTPLDVNRRTHSSTTSGPVEGFARVVRRVAMEKGGDIFQAPERPVGKAKVRVVPDVYFLPRRSIPRTIALYSFLTAAGIGAGMVVEQWINKQVENDTAVLFRKKDDPETTAT